MIEGLKPYSSYVESGMPWVGGCPSHWAIKRGKALFEESHLPVRPDDDIVTCFRDGQVTLRKNRRTSGFMEALYEIGYQGVRKGHLVIHAMDAFAGAVGVSDSNGKCTPEYIVADPRSKEVVPRYFALLIRFAAHQGFILVSCPAVRERAPRFRYSHFGDMMMPVPPPEEQEAIVRFLANANQKIDGFIRAKRKLIGLLNEHKQAIIHQAVTRGLDSSVSLKPSGIPWLGDIPKHWEVKRAKQVCSRIIDCKNRTPERVEGGSYTVVRTTNVRKGIFNPRGSYPTNRRNFEIWTERGAPRIGDVFFTREAPAGEACLVPDRPGLCMGQRMMYFRPTPDLIDPEFLLHSVYGPVVRTYLEHAVNGSTVGHLRLGQVGAIPLLWCPVNEQRLIVAHINRELLPLSNAASRIEREIALMQEYRTRLTADLVTGKLDVWEAASKLPEVQSESTSEDALEEFTDEAEPEDEA